MKITDVSVTSRRSVTIDREYFTFECTLHAEVTDYENDIKKLWEEAHKQVDDQIEEVVKQE